MGDTQVVHNTPLARGGAKAGQRPLAEGADRFRGRLLHLVQLDTVLAICRLSEHEGLPPWFTLAPPLTAVVMRKGELTIVAPDAAVPREVHAERGWRALEVAGPLDLTMTGVMAALSRALAQARVSLFAVSTYDTDVLLVRDAQLQDAVDALRDAGHVVGDQP